jgi:TonB-linked SusC/RagA family outer membrane protein
LKLGVIKESCQKEKPEVVATLPATSEVILKFKCLRDSLPLIHHLKHDKIMKCKAFRQSIFWTNRLVITKTIMVMKITGVILLATCLQVSARSFSQQRISITEKNAKLETILDEIGKKTGYQFFFADLDADLIKGISISVHDASVEDILDLCLKDKPFSYEIIKKMIVIRKKDISNSPPAPSEMPPSDIRGKITDSTGAPLSGAFVQVEGTRLMVTTDENGDFLLRGINSDATLVVSFIGYTTRRIVLDGRTPISVDLKVSNRELSQVTVAYNNGFQKISAERATGSFSFVDNKLFNREVSPDVLSRLDGIVPGLIFNKNTISSATGNYDINIQGHSTLFSNDQPLVVVDNLPYYGNLQNLNPNDVESITVLKDAAAASIWGVQSGNGVIVVTTKRGRKNQKMRVNFNTNVTVGDKPDLHYSPNFLDANDNINITQTLFNQGYYDAYLAAPYYLVSSAVDILAQERAGTISSTDAINQLNVLRTQDVRNDLSKYFYQKSIAQQYALNVQGGGSDNDYFASIGFDNDRSNQVGNTNNRLSLNTNYNYYPMKGLQVSLGVNYIQSTTQTNSPLGNMSQLDPYTKLADAKGNPLPISTDYQPAYKDSLTQTGFLNWQYKPLAEIGLANNITKQIENRINVGIKDSFLYGLSVELHYQYEKASITTNDNFSDSTYYARNLINTYTQGSAGSYTYPIPIGGILQTSNGTLTSNELRGQLNYNHNWNGKHDLTAIAGAELSQTVNESSNSVAYGYNQSVLNNVPSIDYADYFTLSPGGYSSNRIPNNSSFGKTTNNFVSYFSNAAYTYRGTYTLSASGRIDHSNLFGVNTNQKAVPLFSTGLAWIINRESFYHVAWLPILRPRVTYGYTANINTSATAVATISQSTNSTFTGQNYANIANPGNPELRWEKNRKINFGLDYGLKNNVLSGSIDYYVKKSINLFGSSPLAPSTGLTSFFGNTAGTSGHGIDVALNSQNIIRRRFSWTTNFILSHSVDKVTNYQVIASPSSYISNGSGNSGTIVPKVGAPIFGVYSYRFAGLTHDTGDPMGYVGKSTSTDYTAIINNTSVDSMYYDGPSRPRFFGSLRNTFSYQRFSVSFNIQYELQYCFLRSSMSDVNGIGLGLGGGNSDYAKRWQKPGDELHTDVPSMGYAPFDPNRETFYKYSSALVDKGDNVRLKDISLAYDLDKTQWKASPFRQLRLYIYVNNLGILWRANKDHLDPDTYTLATNPFPQPRTFAFGVNAGF